MEEKNKEEMAYEKAIDGYQFLINRYHTWMNYYSIFTGAFFIALYTMWDKNETVECACCKCCETPASAPDYFLLGLLIILGWFSSVCWLASLIGHRAWMGSWIQIVKKWEKQVLGEPSDKPWSSIYGKIVRPTEPQNNDPRFRTQFISTQKVTTIFVYAIILAWDILLGYLVLSSNWAILNNWFTWVIKAVICLLILGANWFCWKCIYKKKCKYYSDDLTDML